MADRPIPPQFGQVEPKSGLERAVNFADEAFLLVEVYQRGKLMARTGENRGKRQALSRDLLHGLSPEEFNEEAKSLDQMEAMTPAMRARLHAPVGLDLGAETPEEVALAILAEMQATLARRDARPLRDRVRPIHE